MQIRQLAQHASCCALSQPATNSSLKTDFCAARSKTRIEQQQEQAKYRTGHRRQEARAKARVKMI